ncbi:MAG: pilus assembly protein PilM [Candidatus Paceibacterota bacterium]
MKRLYNHYFPTPKYLAMSSCAIDISDQSIKYGELVATSSGLRLSKYGKEKIPEGVVVSGKIEKEDELLIILKKIRDKENIKFIRVSLPEEQMYLFTLSIPKTTNEKIRDVILLQIEEYIPLKALDSIFDYDVVSDDGQNILIEVVAIAVTTIEGYLSVFSKADLVPISFEIEAQALARAVIPSNDPSPIMIVDFGDSRTGVSISKNGRIFLTTTLSIGGIDLTNMIAKNFSLSFEEAEKMKHEYGLTQVSKAQNIFPAILNGISVLRDELNKQYTYWETHNNNNAKHEQINHIILCGGDANLAGLSDYLELSMNIKVENANVWVNILNTEDSVPEMSFEESLSYATVLGLSLGGYVYKSQPVINVLPYEKKKILHREYWMRFFTILFNLIALSCMVAALLFFPSFFFSQSKEKLVENKLEVFNRENPDLTSSNIDKIIGDINSKLDILDKAKEPYQVSDRVLNSILSTKTAGITFSQILFNKDVIKTTDPTKKGDISVVEIHGVASNRDSLRNFKTALDNNPNFSEVNLPISNFLEKSDLIFTISIKMK